MAAAIQPNWLGTLMQQSGCWVHGLQLHVHRLQLLPLLPWTLALLDHSFVAAAMIMWLDINVCWTGVLPCACRYIWAVIGMNLFGNIMQTGTGITRHANFESFVTAMLTEFR
jgi:hypothetical protein